MADPIFYAMQSGFFVLALACGFSALLGVILLSGSIAARVVSPKIIFIPAFALLMCALSAAVSSYCSAVIVGALQ